jgi:hypothetical protein
MIKEYEQYHGMALCRLAHKFSGYKISTNVNDDNSSYLINDNFGIYIKHSKKRLTPWSFAFNSEHYEAILRLVNSQQQVFILLVCGMDGICCIDYVEFSQVISKVMDNEIKYISVTRFKNKQYQVSGTDGEIKHKFADSDISLHEGLSHDARIMRDDIPDVIPGIEQIQKDKIYTIINSKDSNIKNTSCKHFDDKSNHCLNTESPYFILNCYGAIRCKHYEKIKNGDGINSITKRFVGKVDIFNHKKTNQGISLGDKVLLYFYECKQQQTLCIGTNNNALSVLERECLGKRNGDKIEVNNSHYVVVNYTKNIYN